MRKKVAWKSGVRLCPALQLHVLAQVSYLGSKKEHLISYMLSFAGYNTQCNTREDVRIVSLPWYEVTTIRQSYWCKRTATSIHSLTLRKKKKNDKLWTVELPFRGHTRDQDKCPLNRVVSSIAVTRYKDYTVESRFFEPPWKKQIGLNYQEVWKITVLAGLAKLGLVRISGSFKKPSATFHNAICSP